jgi:hypothetical protein
MKSSKSTIAQKASAVVTLYVFIREVMGLNLEEFLMFFLLKLF